MQPIFFAEIAFSWEIDLCFAYSQSSDLCPACKHRV